MSIHDWKQYHKMWLQELSLLLNERSGLEGEFRNVGIIPQSGKYR